MDHLVFVAPDLDEGVRYIEDLLGVETSPGGQHHGVGTRNRLVGLGSDMYMEIVSVDPSQPTPARPRWFGLDHVTEPRLATWCVRSANLDGLVKRGRAAGIDLGATTVGVRQRPDGSRLEWTVTDPWAERADGVLPFFIDWGDAKHPARSLPAVCSFVGLELQHPEAATVATWFKALGLDEQVFAGDNARLAAVIETPNGVVELR